MKKGTKVHVEGEAARKTFDEARDSLPPELQPTFEKLCKEVIGWSYFFYGTRFVSYSILRELVADGWRKQETIGSQDSPDGPPNG